MPSLSILKNPRFRQFLSDETGGEKDNINTLLILALVVLPIVFLIIKFGKDAKDKATTEFDDVIGDGVPRP